MPNSETVDPLELTYPLRTVARLTGISPEVLRAWERRHRVVEPQRTPGGTRRYSAQDLEKLRLVKSAVDAGHRVGQVAQMGMEELRERATRGEEAPVGRLDDILAALDRLEGAEAQRLLSMHLSSLGPVRFAQEVALPLGREIGRRWAEEQSGIAQEHMATSVLRSLLGNALQPTAISLLGPRVVFATPSGEPHELGLLMAALAALGAGANPLYLGSQLPVEDMIGAIQQTGAAAIGLSVVTLPGSEATRFLNELREGLDEHVHVWLGGSGAEELAIPAGVRHIATLPELEQRVLLLGESEGAR